MNKIYKVIWSKVKHCYVVASELAKSNGKNSVKSKVGKVSLAAVMAAAVLTGTAVDMNTVWADAAVDTNTTQTGKIGSVSQDNYIAIKYAKPEDKSVYEYEQSLKEKGYEAIEVALDGGGTETYWVQKGYVVYAHRANPVIGYEAKAAIYKIIGTPQGNFNPVATIQVTNAETATTTVLNSKLDEVAVDSYGAITNAGGVLAPRTWHYVLNKGTANQLVLHKGGEDAIVNAGDTGTVPFSDYFVPVSTTDKKTALTYVAASNSYLYNGQTVDSNSVYYLTDEYGNNGQAGVFVVGGQVYNGMVYGNNNEILLTGQTDENGKTSLKTYWGAKIEDDNMTIADSKMTLGNLKESFSILEQNDQKLSLADIKEITLGTADNGGTIGLLYNDGTTAVPGTITMTSGGGEGTDTFVTVSNDAGSFNLATGSKVVANNGEDYTQGANLNTLSINGNTYTIVDTNLVAGDNVTVSGGTVDKNGNKTYTISATDTNNYVTGGSVDYDKGTLTLNRKGMDAVTINGLRDTMLSSVVGKNLTYTDPNASDDTIPLERDLIVYDTADNAVTLEDVARNSDITTGVTITGSNNSAEVKFNRNNGENDYGMTFTAGGGTGGKDTYVQIVQIGKTDGIKLNTGSKVVGTGVPTPNDETVLALSGLSINGEDFLVPVIHANPGSDTDKDPYLTSIELNGQKYKIVSQGASTDYSIVGERVTTDNVTTYNGVYNVEEDNTIKLNLIDNLTQKVTEDAIVINGVAKASDVNALESKVGTVESKVTTVEGKVTTLEGNITTLGKADIKAINHTALSYTVDSEGNVTDNGTLTTTLTKNDDSTITSNSINISGYVGDKIKHEAVNADYKTDTNGNVITIGGALDDHEERISTVEDTYLSGIQEKPTQTNNGTEHKSWDVTVGNTNNKVTITDTVNDTLTSTWTDTADDSDTIANDDVKLTLTDSAGNSVVGYIDNVAKASDVDALEGKVGTVESKVTTVEGKVTTLEGNITTINQNITEIDGRVDTLETTVQKNSTAITDINKNIGDINNTIGDINNTIGGIDGRVVTLETNSVVGLEQTGPSYQDENGDTVYTGTITTTLVRPDSKDNITQTVDISDYVEHTIDVNAANAQYDPTKNSYTQGTIGGALDDHEGRIDNIENTYVSDIVRSDITNNGITQTAWTVTEGDKTGTNAVVITDTTNHELTNEWGGTQVTNTNNEDKITITLTDTAGYEVTTTLENVAKATDVDNLTDVIGAGTTTELTNQYGGNNTTYINNATTLVDADIQLDQAIKNVAETAAKHTTVSKGTNILVTTDDEPNANGGTNYIISTADDVTFNTVTATTGITTPQITLNGSTVTYANDRITYTAANSTKTVATLDDGMTFGADEGSIELTLDSTQNNIAIKGDGTNITTTADANTGAIKVALNDDITVNNVTSNTINATTVKVGDSVTINDNGITIENGDNDVVVSKTEVNVGGNKVTNVQNGDIAYGSTDAVNGGQLWETNQAVNNLSGQVNRLGHRTTKAVAGAAALAALHPLDFDPDDKLSFSAGVGNYGGSTAAAIGAFYRPNERVMFSIGGTVGNGEDMVNAGVSFALGKGGKVNASRVAAVHEINELRQQVAYLSAVVAQMAERSGYQFTDMKPFPDTPENHWAYEYVAKLAAEGIIEGYPDGNFSGDRTMTRYEYAAMLFRALEKGVQLDARVIDEFEPELGRLSVERIKGEQNQKEKIERVRLNNTAPDRDAYGGKINVGKNWP